MSDMHWPPQMSRDVTLKDKEQIQQHWGGNWNNPQQAPFHHTFISLFNKTVHLCICFRAKQGSSLDPFRDTIEK